MQNFWREGEREREKEKERGSYIVACEIALISGSDSIAKRIAKKLRQSLKNSPYDAMLLNILIEIFFFFLLVPRDEVNFPSPVLRRSRDILD